MKRTGIVFALIGACLMLAPNLAQAQATRTWISGVGDDVNPCSRTAPCKTFPGAISKTAAGGEIDTLDPGGFGAVTVTKAITLANEGIGEAGILVAGTNGVTVNCATDPNCSVVLRGLQIDGGPIGSNSLNGVRFVAGKSLIIENCAIRNFTGGSPNGYGVQFNPSATQTHFLTIAHSTIQNNGTSGNGAGVLILPSGSATVNASVVNDVVTQNNIGVRADGTNLTGGGITVNVSDSAVTNNTNAGVASVSTNTNPVKVIVSNAQVTGNGVGLNANGTAQTILRVGYSTVSFNSGGGYKQQNLAVLSSYGNNIFSDNGADTGTLSTSPGLQ